MPPPGLSLRDRARHFLACEFRRVVALLWLASQCGFASAKPADGYLIKNWSTSDGLPENTVRAIVETRDGYLWIGTADGLARFDGVRFTRFTSINTPALFSDDIFGLYEDRSGALWINTRRGLLRYCEGRFNAIRLRPGEPPAVFGNFTEDSQGRLWMSGPAGLARWKDGKVELVPLPTDGPHGIIRLCARQQGGLWLTTAEGLWWYHGGKVGRVQVSPPPQLIAASRDGTLWGLVEGHRLFKFQGDVWSQVADVGDENCATLYAASNGDVWIGAASRNRAFRLHAGQLTEVSGKDGLDGNSTLCFAEDRDGSLWLGMNGAGLFRLRERRLQLFDRKAGLPSLSVASVCEDAAGTMFVSVMGWALQCLTNGRFEPAIVTTNGDPYQLATALVPARAGGVWAGTFNGSLPRIQNGRVVERIGSAAGTRALFTDRDGGLWRGTRTAGIEYFSGTNLTRFSTHEGLSFDNVNCFAQDQTGAIWAGTEEGLNRIDHGQITRFTTADGLGHNFISALCVDSRGTLWVGTLGGGLSAWNGTRFITLSVSEGLPDDDVAQLIEDNRQHLWIGTRSGLMGVALTNLHDFLAGKVSAVTGTLIGRNEGLVRPDCWTEFQPAAIKARDGRLWFCTSSGVVAIDPRRFDRLAPPPIVHVEEVTVDGVVQSEVQKSKAEFKIPPGRQSIEIRYTGISPSGPELVRFRYQLRGYDRDWVEAGHARTASYLHLKPGHYEFLVKAANNDGVWNDTGDTLAIIVEPEFYQTTWFRALLLVAFIGSGPTFYFRRVRRLERQRAAQEDFSRRLIASQEQERKRIAAELHDSLGQNLLVIKNRAALALARKDQPEMMAAQVTEVSATASAAIREVRTIAQNLRPFQIDELGLTKSIAAVVRKLGDSSPIQFTAELENIDRALAPESELNFFRIVQECLNNIVKHSQAKAATLRLRRHEHVVHLTVTDDGCGFVLEQACREAAAGFGLRNAAERVRTLGGKIIVHSRRGEGTRIEIEVPVNQ